MLENPCFIISLQTGAKIIAALDILLAAIPLAIILSGVIPGYGQSKNIVDVIENTINAGVNSSTRLGTNYSAVNVIVEENRSYVALGTWTIMIFFVVMDVAVSYILYRGAQNRQLKKLKMWFYIRSLILVLTTIMLIASICLKITFRIVVYDCFLTIYRIYTLWVVHAFIHEVLMENRRMQNASYYSKTFGAPPSIIVTAATAEGDIRNAANGHSNSNGNSKFGFDNIGYS